MGQDIIMNVHITGLDLRNEENYKSQVEVLNKIFPEKDEKNSTSDYTVKYSKKPKWKAFIYSDQNTTNFSFINKNIQAQINKYQKLQDKDKKEKNNKKEGLNNQMIIHFVSDNSDDLLLDEFNKDNSIDNLGENFPLILFLFKDTDKNNIDYNESFFDFSYIRCLNLKNIYSGRLEGEENKPSKEDLIAVYLYSFLYNNYDSYFTERGHKIIDEIDPLSKKPKFGIYLPIILIGNTGAGKSTFINIFNGSRISRASSSQLPVTSKSAYYDVKIPGNDNGDAEFDNDGLRQEAFIRFIDTPGFDLEKDIDIAQKEIRNIYLDFKEGKERIPVVLFFINPIGRNGTKDKNKEKKKLKILKFIKEKKYKIIFVVTHLGKKERWESKKSFIKYLEDNQLDDLIEKDESNIIKCQLVGENAYGIKEIFKKIYKYTNFIEDNDLKQTGKLYVESLKEEIKRKETFDEKLKFLKEKTNLFDEFESKEDIIKYGNRKTIALLLSMSLCAALAGAIPVPFADIPIVLTIIGTAIIKIGKFYGYVWKTISKQDLLSIYNGELYENNNHENLETYTNVSELLKIIGEIITKTMIMGILLNIDDYLKLFWGVGTLIGVALGASIDTGIISKYIYRAKRFFESKCEKDDGTIFFYTRCSEYEVIFRHFKRLENYKLIYP